MLPTILSECLCSLLENEKRFAFTMDVCIDGNEIVDVTFKNTLIQVKKNLRYDSPDIEDNITYQNIFKILTNLNKKYKYTDNITTNMMLLHIL